MKSEYLNVLSDLMETGPMAFSNSIFKKSIDECEKRELICLIASQFLAYKDIAEKLNTILKEIHSIFFQ